MSPAFRAKVTGLGVVSACGVGYPALLRALQLGQSHLRPPTLLDPRPLGISLAGEVPHLTSPEPRAYTLMELALKEALDLARLGSPQLGSAGLWLGTAQGNLDRGSHWHVPPPGIDPTRWERSLPGWVTQHLHQRLGLGGPATTLSMACVSGGMAIHAGLRALARGEIDIAIVGGFEAISPFIFEGFSSLGALSPTTCRPFDRGGYGMVLGEGAACLVLERDHRVLDRGGKIWGEILGVGRGSDITQLTTPHPDARGMRAAIHQALCASGLTTQDIDFLHCHGTGTAPGDTMELTGVSALFGNSPPPMVATKGITGHTLGAAAALETVMDLLILSGDFLPSVVGLNQSMEASPVDLVTSRRPLRANTSLGTWFAFGGHHVAVVCGRSPENSP